ncbi:glycosyl transferase family 2 [Gordonia bronchialis DSM 43247]|uniref:Glycosyl transferase family 2 n=1 Tax=Gordonia bronchialis (strain ATCC 25592 / DSM 43247 / BCRC 13721 / JCM 3198 / KCTC 3076 / NBRC 16047 / NCTC 10667) TaxID=526226 RepID=D0LER3_GORB4|nr:glycosyltransferase family A protein [Gordonia bronchialis]ACY21787.1 glycosyl transferase family 2 [Gordonia bronchialis DSM 43247]MCC3324575.1 glycosyltransferase family 2 protein [Gordonia bronchialis]STQ64676.1 4,4'-diaponeurosporenoate glycosyltransferase [Gordonia bronchialis]
MSATDRWQEVVRVGAVLAVGSLALTVRNAMTLRQPDLTAVPHSEPLVVLLPVRDEASNVIDCLDAILAALDRWPGPGRVIVLDDESTDGTAELAVGYAGRDPRVEVITGTPTPHGWLGKPWACAQLARRADDAEGLLIFVDADVRVRPCAFVAAGALLRDTGLDLVSPYPRQRADTVAERLIQPLLQWSWMSTLPLRLAERTARPSMSVANGQLLVVDAGVYRRAGGHHAVRAEVIEDIALLRAVKAVGGRGGVTEGSQIAECRMYTGAVALRDGYRKSLWAAFGSSSAAVAVVGLLVVVHVVPAIAMVGGSRAGLVGYLAGVTSRAVVAATTHGRIWPDVAAHPISILAFGLLTADSMIARRRGTARWKGRTVAVGR